MARGNVILALCPACSCPMEPDDSRCPVCFHNVEPSSAFLPCDACMNPIAWYDVECNNCRTQWSIAYWEDRWFAEHEAAKDTDTDLSDLLIDFTTAQECLDTEKLWDSYNICCEKSKDDCICPYPISGEAVANLSLDLYDQDAECMNCAWMMTSVCPSLRTVTKNFFESTDGSNEEYEQFVENTPKIVPCEVFRLDMLER